MKKGKKKICPVCGIVHRNYDVALRCYETAVGIAELNFKLNGNLPLSIQRQVIETENLLNSLT